MKQRYNLTAMEKQILRNALHTEDVLTDNYPAMIDIRIKLGLVALAGEKQQEMPK